VPGNVDLGHHRDVAVLRVPDDPLVVLLAVEAAAATAHLAAAAVAGQLRPTVDRDPPSLVIGQVQVQDVQLVERDQVDVALDLVDAEEVPGDVEGGAAPGEPRTVHDPHGRDPPGAALDGRVLDLRRQELAQGLDPAEQALGAARPQGHGDGAHLQLVPLVAELAVPGGLQDDAVALPLTTGAGHRQRVAGRPAQYAGEVGADAGGRRRARRAQDPRGGVEREAGPGRAARRGRRRDDAQVDRWLHLRLPPGGVWPGAGGPPGGAGPGGGARSGGRTRPLRRCAARPERGERQHAGDHRQRPWQPGRTPSPHFANSTIVA